MVRNLSRILFLLALLAVLFFCIGGCVVLGEESRHVKEKGGPPPWVPAQGHRAKHAYRYYPVSEVYFDPGRGVYFYMGGGRWQVGAVLPTGIHIDVADYVSIEMDTDCPYENHPEVVKKYPPGQMKKLMKGKGKNKWN